MKASRRSKSTQHARKRRAPAPIKDGILREAGAQRITVLICDDHRLFREGIRAILSADPAIEVVGEAHEGSRAVEEAIRIRPDVVLMDVLMPSLIGYEAVHRIVQSDPNIKLLVLTMYEDEEIIRRCLRAGASGYVVKDAPAAQLVEAVHTIHEGGQYLSPRVLKKVVSDYTAAEASSLDTSYDTLTAREREVLKLLAEGYSVKEISGKLNLSVKTAEVHKYNLMRKLDLHDRTQLIKYALGRKLIVLPTVD